MVFSLQPGMHHPLKLLELLALGHLSLDSEVSLPWRACIPSTGLIVSLGTQFFFFFLQHRKFLDP
jgi:hypothetical protein